MYPDVPPMWFSDSDDSEIIALIEKCNSVSSPSHLLLHMLHMLVLELSRIKKVKPSDDLSNLTVLPTEVSFLFWVVMLKSVIGCIVMLWVLSSNHVSLRRFLNKCIGNFLWRNEIVWKGDRLLEAMWKSKRWQIFGIFFFRNIFKCYTLILTFVCCITKITFGAGCESWNL